MSRNRRRHGFILLLTLVLLALAAIALVSLCRASLRAAVNASREADDLQVRWGDLSCRTVFLPRAEAILSEAETKAKRPVARERVQVVLGNVRFDLLVADEQAKPNVTVLGDRHGNGDVERIARAVSGERLRVFLRPTLRPATDPKRAGASVPVFGSFGQVYDGGDPTDLLAASRGFTCWGNGRLNWRRASAAALGDVATEVLRPQDIQALLAARGVGPEVTFSKVLAGGALGESRPDLVDSILTDVSTCHSVWITASVIEPAPEGGSKPRPLAGRYSLTVRDDDDSSRGTASFSW